VTDFVRYSSGLMLNSPPTGTFWVALAIFILALLTHVVQSGFWG
jgi:hypothetical protein